MGCCVSKNSSTSKSPSASPSQRPVQTVDLKDKVNNAHSKVEEKPKAEEMKVIKKEVFVIRHSRNNSREIIGSDKPPSVQMQSACTSSNEKAEASTKSNNNNNTVIMDGASSCRTKEELVDGSGVLAQCGRLGRSFSMRKYSGIKRRSFDLEDRCAFDDLGNTNCSRNDQRQRSLLRRSKSWDRVSFSGMRRSQSPARHSEPDTSKVVEAVPEKMIKRIIVKRNVGAEATLGSRGIASPRSESPAIANGLACCENQQQPCLLSRNSSRNARRSPHRRKPLSEIGSSSLVLAAKNTCPRSIDKGVPGDSQLEASHNLNQKSNSKMNRDRDVVQARKYGSQSNDRKRKHSTNASSASEAQSTNVEEAELNQPLAITVPAVDASCSGRPHSQSFVRSRSFRQSEDTEMGTQRLSNPASSYTALLLEDIQRFHQKSNHSFSLSDSASKTCSVLEGVADLNSSTRPTLRRTLSEERKIPCIHQSNENYNISSGNNDVDKRKTRNKIPFLEADVNAEDDLMAPSYHKYVTVRRGGIQIEDMEDQESYGSNSFVGTWGLYSSSWEPNSADSIKSYTMKTPAQKAFRDIPCSENVKL